MRQFGIALMIVSVLVLLFYWPVGFLLFLVALVLIVAGKPSKYVTCATCGNPVAKTANLCPTCSATLVPTEGPLVADFTTAPDEATDDAAWTYGGRASS